MINGKNVYLKKLSSESIDNLYYQWINDKDITRFMVARDQTYSIEDLKKYVKEMNDSENNYFFGIYLKENNKYIGNIKVGNIDASKTANIGIMIGDRSVWGKGYASDAISCIVDFSFNSLNLNKLIAGMFKINYGSYKSFINNEFEDVNIESSTVLFEGKMEETVLVEKKNK